MITALVFIKKFGKLFLITPKHNFFKCDTLTNIIYTPYTESKFYVKIQGHYVYFDLQIPIINENCYSLQADTDLVVFNVDSRLTKFVNTIEDFIPTLLPNKIDASRIFGRGIEDSSHYTKIADPHKVPLDKYSVTFNPICDSLHCSLNFKPDAFETYKGFSGSPVFVKNAKTKRWEFVGLFNYVNYSKKSGDFIFYAIKPTYILEKINELNLKLLNTN